MIAFFLSLVGSIARSPARLFPNPLARSFFCIDSVAHLPSKFTPVQSIPLHTCVITLCVDCCVHVVDGVDNLFDLKTCLILTWPVCSSSPAINTNNISDKLTSRRAMICQILANLYSLSYDTMNTRSHARTHARYHVRTHLYMC